MFVFNRMTANPVTITPDTMVSDASDLMRTNKFRRLPIVKDGKLVGIITDRDLREVAPSPATTLSVHEAKYLLAKMQVKDIMKTKVLTILPTATIEEAALVLYKKKIGGLVVVDEQQAVVGVITETDIFKTFVDLMGILDQNKIRITIDVTDKVGVLSDITAIFKELDANITSLLMYPLGEAKLEMVIRAEVKDRDTLFDRLAVIGYPVSHWVQMGAD